MNKNLMVVAIVTFIMILGFQGLVQADTTMSWEFQVFNNPNARQVAHNIAKAQKDLSKKEKDPIAEFKDGLDRRLQSSVQRDIMDMIFNDDRVAAGEYEVGKLNVRIAEEPETGLVILEITNTETGETTIVEYSTDEWPTDYSSSY